MNSSRAYFMDIFTSGACIYGHGYHGYNKYWYCGYSHLWQTTCFTPTQWKVWSGDMICCSSRPNFSCPLSEKCSLGMCHAQTTLFTEWVWKMWSRNKTILCPCSTANSNPLPRHALDYRYGFIIFFVASKLKPIEYSLIWHVYVHVAILLQYHSGYDVYNT